MHCSTYKRFCFSPVAPLVNVEGDASKLRKHAYRHPTLKRGLKGNLGHFDFNFPLPSAACNLPAFYEDVGMKKLW